MPFPSHTPPPGAALSPIRRKRPLRPRRTSIGTRRTDIARCTAGRTGQRAGSRRRSERCVLRGRPSGRRVPGIRPPVRSSCRPVGRRPGCGAPALHDRLPGQLDSHLARSSRTTTDTTATATVVTAMPTITARPLHDASRSLARSHEANRLRSPDFSWSRQAGGKATPRSASSRVSTPCPTNEQGFGNREAERRRGFSAC